MSLYVCIYTTTPTTTPASTATITPTNTNTPTTPPLPLPPPLQLKEHCRRGGRRNLRARGGVPWSAVLWTRHGCGAHELSAVAAITCTRTRKYRVDGPQAPCLTEELLAHYSCWEKENYSFCKGVSSDKFSMLQWMDPHSYTYLTGFYDV